MALQVEVAEISTRAKQAELQCGAERTVTKVLREEVAKLERKLATLRAGMEAEKTAASLAYFQERSEELVAMGAEFLTEGREVGWAQCKEKMLALVRAKLPELDIALTDPDLATVKEAADGTSAEAFPDAAGRLNEPTRGSGGLDPEGRQDEVVKDLAD